MKRSFTRNRLIPDYYERLLGDNSARYVNAFQSVGMWDATSRFAPKVLGRVSGDGAPTDKQVLRFTLERLGAPQSVNAAQKDPMQRSSGIITDLASQVRPQLAADPVNCTYTDPLTDAEDIVGARVAVLLIRGH